jgi:hypothetical protein
MTTDTLKTGRSAGDRTFGGGLVIAGAGSAGSVIARRLIGAGDMCTCLNRTADRNDNDCQPIQPRQRSTTTSEQITESALAAVQSAPDPRIRQITVALVHHLHDLAREIRLQPDELLAAADFLKGCGEISDAARHEFILLSDVLGLTMVVDTLGPDLPAGALETSVLGPFYRAAPRSNPTATIFPMATTTNRHTSSAGSLIRPAGRSPVPNSMSGVPTTTGSTKTSIRPTRLQPARALPHQHRRPLRAVDGQIGQLPDPRRRPGRRPAARDRPKTRHIVNRSGHIGELLGHC